jgi:hypothetical protein
MGVQVYEIGFYKSSEKNCGSIRIISVKRGKRGVVLKDGGNTVGGLEVGLRSGLHFE